MVGLSIVLEFQKGSKFSKKPAPVINKAASMINNSKPHPSAPNFSSPSFSSSFSRRNSNTHSRTFNFLDRCFLCKHKLLPGNDIYMYKGDKGFCSVECRCRQIFMDEEEFVGKDNCSLSAIKPTLHSTSSSSSDPSRRRKTTRNPGDGVAY